MGAPLSSNALPRSGSDGDSTTAPPSCLHHPNPNPSHNPNPNPNPNQAPTALLRHPAACHAWCSSP
eukprot:scaffold105498_cov41-Phaeocystis_antarctica.AAC.1